MVDPLKPTDAASRIDDVTEEALMDRYCAGDVAAFDELFRRFRGRLVRFLTPMVGRAQAQDVAQVAFLKIHENRHRYQTGRSVAAWFFTIAKNTALDHLRSASHRREKTGIEIEAEAPARGRDIWRDEQVRQALAQIPDGERTVILLHWFGELSFEEVAEAVGASHAAVRVRAHRGYDKLRASLEALKAEVVS